MKKMPIKAKNLLPPVLISAATYAILVLTGLDEQIKKLKK